MPGLRWGSLALPGRQRRVGARLAICACALGLALLQGCGGGGGGGSSSEGPTSATLTVTIGSEPVEGGACEGDGDARLCTVPQGEELSFGATTVMAGQAHSRAIKQAACPEGVCCAMRVSGDALVDPPLFSRHPHQLLYETAVDPATGIARLVVAPASNGEMARHVLGLNACQFTLEQSYYSPDERARITRRASGQRPHEHFGHSDSPESFPNLNVTWIDDRFHLQDTTRQGRSLAAGASISTLKFLHDATGDEHSQVLHSAAEIADLDKAAVDAHGYTRIVHDYLWSEFGRMSWDGEGSSMVAVTHIAIEPDDDDESIDPAESFNALWYGHAIGFTVVPDDRPQQVAYSVALDVVAHEWGHAVSDSLSADGRGLRYERESGALEEAFADWMGAAVERTHRGRGREVAFVPHGGSTQRAYAGWIIGEDNGITRVMSDPPDLNDPDTYMGTHWVPVDEASCPEPDFKENDYCGVHTNNGVGNKMFYLLSDGGRFGGERVAGIGIQNALRVAFDAHRDHWSEASDYAAARRGMVAAAQTLDRANGTRWADSVRAAWTAVGVDGP